MRCFFVDWTRSSFACPWIVRTFPGFPAFTSHSENFMENGTKNRISFWFSWIILHKSQHMVHACLSNFFTFSPLWLQAACFCMLYSIHTYSLSYVEVDIIIINIIYFLLLLFGISSFTDLYSLLCVSAFILLYFRSEFVLLLLAPLLLRRDNVLVEYYLHEKC